MSGTPTPPAYESLDENELVVFDSDIKRLASMYSRFGSSLGQVWLEDRDALLWSCSIAKKQFTGLEFRGLRALGSSTFGMQVIRPIYINTTQTWLASYTATGWSTLVWNVALSGTTGTARNTQNRVVLAATRYVNYATSPKARELRMVVGPTTYPVELLDWAYIGGLYMTRAIGTVLVSKNGTFSTDLNIEFQGVDGTALWGVAFGTGDWLNSET